MKKLFLYLSFILIQFRVSAQCNYVWAQWTNQGLTDTAYATLSVNGAPLGMTMTANFDFDFTPSIFNYGVFSPYSNIPVNNTVPRTTWAVGAGGQTTMCFSQPVTNPILLLASLGNVNQPVILTFSNPYNLLFDGGGNVYTNTVTIDALEGNCIIEFPGTFTCVTIYSSTPEFYTNLTWGIKNPLTAGFTFTNPCQNNLVSFSSATSSINAPGSIISYAWNFGDGAVSLTQNPSHIYSTAGTYQVQLVVTSNSLCTDTLTQLVTVYPVSNINNPVSLCGGQSYSINSHSYSTSGTYYDTLSTIWGCDSIVITQLTVSQAASSINLQTICSGFAYYLNGHTYSQSGSYFDTLTTSTGCDSVVNTQLTLTAIPFTVNQHTICQGGSYTFNSHFYSLSGNYYDTLSSVAGCDSVIETQLSVVPSYTSNNPHSICPGETYLFNSHSYGATGSYYDTLTSVAGCDSVVITSITINPIPSVSFLHPPDICIDAPAISLNYASPNGGQYSGPGVFNNMFDPKTANTGVHLLTYTYSDPATSCINSAQENITVLPSPVAQLYVTPKYASLADANISFLDLTPGNVTAHWNFGDGFTLNGDSGIHVYNDTGHFQISLTVTDLFGCKDETVVTVIIEAEFEFYVPNAFTPNGDGINDYFSGNGIGIGEYSMSIYDRWGLQIFKTNDVSTPWSGKDVPGDTYVYRINFSDVYGESHEYVGRVSVVR